MNHRKWTRLFTKMITADKQIGKLRRAVHRLHVEPMVNAHRDCLMTIATELLDMHPTLEDAIASVESLRNTQDANHTVYDDAIAAMHTIATWRGVERSLKVMKGRAGAASRRDNLPRGRD